MKVKIVNMMYMQRIDGKELLIISTNDDKILFIDVNKLFGIILGYRNPTIKNTLNI